MVTDTASVGYAGVPLGVGHLVFAQREGPPDPHRVLRAFPFNPFGSEFFSCGFVLGRAHDDLAGRDHHHFGTFRAVSEYIAGLVKVLTGGEQTPTMSKPQTIPDFHLAVPG